MKINLLNNIIRIYLSIQFVIVSGFAMTQTNADSLLREVEAKLSQYHDYTADVVINIDVDFINIPDKSAVMYFKQPDQVTFKSDNFIMLPKKGLDFSLSRILKEEHTAILSGYDSINGRNYVIIKILPLAKKSEIILLNAWIDVESKVVAKMENFTRSKGCYTVDLTYDHPELFLPSRIHIFFELEQIKLPLQFIGKEVKVDEKKLDEEGIHRGKVTIWMSNYQVNTGLSDSLFD